MQLIWTREALDKLAEIEEYISKDSPERAINFITYLVDQEEMLKDHPHIGRVAPELGNDNIRELIVRKYRIIYKLSDKKIEMLTVFEGHRLLRLDELEIN